MAGYLALQIMKGNLSYAKVMSKFSKYKPFPIASSVPPFKIT